MSDKIKSDTRSRLAFTLIELLVVIAIIGVLAALIIPLAGVATTKMRTARVSAELNGLITAIESYKTEVGEYPPDNGDLRFMSATDPRYKTNAALSPLFYELVGTIFTNRDRASQQFVFVSLQGEEALGTNQIGKVFKRDGIRNSARRRAEVEYKSFSVKPSQYAELHPNLTDGADVEIMVVPVPGPFTLLGKNNARLNPWFYDASSTNRNNRATYDLWAEVNVGGRTNIIGNWKN